MMLIAPMVKTAAIFLAKIFVLYLMLFVLWIDFVLFETASPRFFFKPQPFVQSTVFALVISAAVSIAIRSKTPIVFAIFCLGYSACFFIFPYQATWFIALFCVLAAINFLYRNKITEPFLVMLLIIAGSWVFISFIYPSYLVGWANYVTDQKDFSGSIFEGFGGMKDQFFSTIIIIPVVAMYFLGKHNYVKIHSAIKYWHKRKSA